MGGRRGDGGRRGAERKTRRYTGCGCSELFHPPFELCAPRPNAPAKYFAVSDLENVIIIIEIINESMRDTKRRTDLKFVTSPLFRSPECASLRSATVSFFLFLSFFFSFSVGYKFSRMLIGSRNENFVTTLASCEYIVFWLADFCHGRTTRVSVHALNSN